MESSLSDDANGYPLVIKERQRINELWIVCLLRLKMVCCTYAVLSASWSRYAVHATPIPSLSNKKEDDAQIVFLRDFLKDDISMLRLYSDCLWTHATMDAFLEASLVTAYAALPTESEESDCALQRALNMHGPHAGVATWGLVWLQILESILSICTANILQLRNDSQATASTTSSLFPGNASGGSIGDTSAHIFHGENTLTEMLTMLQAHCTFNGILESRPDLVLVCMRVHSLTAVKMIVKCVLSISSENSCPDGDQRRDPKVQNESADATTSLGGDSNFALYRALSRELMEARNQSSTVTSTIGRTKSLFRRHATATNKVKTDTTSSTSARAADKSVQRLRSALLRAVVTLIAVGAYLISLSESSDRRASEDAMKVASEECKGGSVYGEEAEDRTESSEIRIKSGASEHKSAGDYDDDLSDTSLGMSGSSSAQDVVPDVLHGLRYCTKDVQACVDTYCDIVDVCVTQSLPSGIDSLPIRNTIAYDGTKHTSPLCREDFVDILYRCKDPQGFNKIFPSMPGCSDDPYFVYLLGEVQSRVHLQMYAWRTFISTNFVLGMRPNASPSHSHTLVNSGRDVEWIQNSHEANETMDNLRLGWSACSQLGSLYNLLEVFCWHEDSLCLQHDSAAAFLVSLRKIISKADGGCQQDHPGLSFVVQERCGIQCVHNLLELVKCRSELLTTIITSRDSLLKIAINRLSTSRRQQPVVLSIRDMISLQYMRKYDLHCEQQHQCLRNTLHDLLASGYWELGLQLLGRFVGEYKDVLYRFQQSAVSGSGEGGHRHVFIHGHLLSESAVTSGKQS